MKKIRLIVLTIGILCLFAVFTCANAANLGEQEITKAEVSNHFTLPESLVIIEDEAFEGTAITVVDLPPLVTTIGERAFAYISTLRDVRIPITTTSIANSAFTGSNHLTITAALNSYARTWARTNRVPFSPIVMFCASMQTTAISSIDISRSQEVIESDSSTDFKPETQWRRIEEINVTRTEELIANHVQGRSPPMA